MWTREHMRTTKTGKPRGKGACPSWLFARWYEIRNGGSQGYKDFGSELVRAAVGLELYEDTEDVWQAKIEKLEALFGEGDDNGILAWFDENVPRIMTLVPSRRRGQLIEGVYERLEYDEEVFVF